MTRLFVVVEGDTEQEFVKRVLAPHLHARNVWTTPIVVTTKRDRKTCQKLARGGGHWRHWRDDIRRLLRSDTACHTTSMFDLYGLPADFPSLRELSAERDTVQRAKALETAMGQDIQDPRFIPYIQRHEFEALVLAGLEHLNDLFVGSDTRAGLDMLRQQLRTLAPEDVNDGKATAPSKRLIALIPEYNKKIHGLWVTGKVGIDSLKMRCPRFGDWVASLEAL